MDSSFNFSSLVKFWWQFEDDGFKGFTRVLRYLTSFSDFKTLIFELLVQFYLSGQIFVKNGPFKLYLLRRSRFCLVELDKCFVVLDLTRVWSIVFIWETFYCPHFGA